MRVTNSMIAGRVTYNAQNSLNRFLNLQTQMSTGKKINKPSDDPLGITRDLEYRKELANNSQFQGNIKLAESWYNQNEGIFNSLSLMAIEAKANTVSAADASNTEGIPALKLKIDENIRALLDYGNTKDEGKFMFSGFKIDQPAFQAHSNGVTFQGDNGVINYQIDANMEHGVNMNGAEMFLKPLLTLGEGFDLNSAISGSTQLDDLHGGTGINQTPGLIQITDVNLGITATIDLNAETSIDQVLLQINNELIANGITNVTARISDTNNSLMFETTQTGFISGVTPLNNINSGAGVTKGDGLIRVTDGAGIDVNVNLSTATTINDVITQFNSQMTTAGISNVTMAINATGTGFEINDTNGVPLNLRIEDMNVKSHLAGQLGINGSIDPTLTGGDLNPQVHFAIEEFGGGTIAEDLGILDEFNSDLIGKDLNTQLLTSTNLSDLNNGLGLTMGEISMWQGGDNAVIDLNDTSLVTVQDLLDVFNNSGLDVTASLNAGNTGIQVVNNDPNSSFTIEGVNGNAAAKDLGIYGSSDLIGSFLVLQKAMGSEDQEAIGLMLENMDLVGEHVSNQRAINASKAVRLASTEHRLLAQAFMFTSRLSELEDADLTEVITNLSIYENNYQAALMASAKIIQPSLLNFLR